MFGAAWARWKLANGLARVFRVSQRAACCIAPDRAENPCSAGGGAVRRSSQFDKLHWEDELQSMAAVSASDVIDHMAGLTPPNWRLSDILHRIIFSSCPKWAFSAPHPMVYITYQAPTNLSGRYAMFYIGYLTRAGPPCGVPSAPAPTAPLAQRAQTKYPNLTVGVFAAPRLPCRPPTPAARSTRGDPPPA